MKQPYTLSSIFILYSYHMKQPYHIISISISIYIHIYTLSFPLISQSQEMSDETTYRLRKKIVNYYLYYLSTLLSIYFII